MADDELPPEILAKHPELVAIGEALAAYHEGRPSTAVCPVCGLPLTVTEVPGTDELWVTCPTGCTRFRARRKRTDEAP
jgi:hypothetical protein